MKKFVCFFITIIFLYNSNAHAQSAAYLNPKLSVEKRVNDLVSRANAGGESKPDAEFNSGNSPTKYSTL